MQRWQDELTKHPLNTALKQIIDFLESDRGVSDSTSEVERIRFTKVIYSLRDAISKLDPDLAPIDLMDQILSQLNNHSVIQVVQSLSSGNNSEAYRDLNTRLIPSLSYIAQLRASTNISDVCSTDVQVATEALERFTHEIDKQRKDFESTLDVMVARLDQIKNTVDDTDATAQRSIENFTAQVNVWHAQAEEIANGQEASFHAFLNNSTKAFKERITEVESNFKMQIKDFFLNQDEDATKKSNNIQSKLDTIIKDSDAKHKNILELYELVAIDSVTGGHKRIADREHAAAENWRNATVLSIGVVLLWLLASLFWIKPELGSDREFWLQLGKSVSLTALMISFAVYASKQAAVHRMNERKARSFFLQVQAFDPFIESLEYADKQQLKKELSAKIFSPEDIQYDQATLENSAFKALDRAIGLVDRVIKIKSK